MTAATDMADAARLALAWQSECLALRSRVAALESERDRAVTAAKIVEAECDRLRAERVDARGALFGSLRADAASARRDRDRTIASANAFARAARAYFASTDAGHAFDGMRAEAARAAFLRRRVTDLDAANLRLLAARAVDVARIASLESERDTLAAIVRDFASMDAPSAIDFDTCDICRVRDVRNPERHGADCAWRRAHEFANPAEAPK